MINSTKIPGPFSFPLSDSKRGAWSMLKFHCNHLIYMEKLNKQYGDIVSLAKGNHNFVFLFSSEYCKQLLTNTKLFHTDLFILRMPENSSLKRLSTGILNMNGTEHRNIRRFLVPFFSLKRTPLYHENILSITKSITDSWPLTKEFDLAEKIKQLTVAIAMNTIFGLPLKNNSDISFITKNLDEQIKLIFSLKTFLFPVSLPYTPYQRLLKLAEDLESKLLSIIRSRRQKANLSDDVLSQLVSSPDLRLTDQEIVPQLNALMIASFETTSNTLIWTLLLLLQHPETLNTLVKEIDTIVGKTPSLENLQKCSFLDFVIKESLRLLPVVSFGGRVSQDNCQIGGYDVPKKAILVYSPYIIHRNSSLFEHPRKFLPHRWDNIKPTTEQYLPFGMGFHQCLGGHFAMMEIKTILVYILQKFRFSIVEKASINYRTKPLLVMDSKFPIVAHSQDYQFQKTKIKGNIHQLIDIS